MKKLSGKQFFLGVILILGIVIVGIGGKIYMDNKRLEEEMVQVVKSEEAKEIIISELKGLDSKALTPEGKIKSYEIDYDSIEHNPMGGVLFKAYVNDDKKLIFNSGFNRYIDGNTGQYGKIESTGIDISLELDDFISGGEKNE